MRSRIGALFLLALPAFAQVPRQVAAPPSDILGGIVRLPDPESSATRSRAAMRPVAFAPARDGTWTARVELDVDATGPLALAFLARGAEGFRVELENEDGSRIELARIQGVTRAVHATIDDIPGRSGLRFDLRDARAGRLTLIVTAVDERDTEAAWFLARTSGAIELAAWTSTVELVADGPVALRARIGGSFAAVDSVRSAIETPSGMRELELADDGAHSDGLAGDGVFGALLPRGLTGTIRARVEARGTTRGGLAFARAAHLAFPVLERRLLLDGGVATRALDELRVELALGALPLGPATKLHVSAEVWGADSAGVLVPLCWLSRQVLPRVERDRWALPLELDRRWIELADARAPFELRHVRVQDPDTEVVFHRIDALDLALPTLAPRTGGPATAVAPEMLVGGPSTLLAPPSATGLRRPATLAPTAPALMLVHGYCSSGSIWPAADFTAPKVEFLDPNQNRSHDQFAQLLAQRADQAGLGSFGVVAHSQGGCAALHLLTYYDSPLDSAVGPRRIQSVATPYQGTPLASLGGFACGTNSDMTPAGAVTWLAGIPTWARNQVFFWTTSNSGSACNFLTDFLLTNPEDGTVERVRGDLPGGNSMGHVTGWCHTTGMSNPANYTDHARNAAMNAAAAR